MLRVERLVTRQLVLTTRTEEDGGPLSLDQLRSRYQRLATGRSSDGSELYCNWIVHRRGGQPLGAMQTTVALDDTQAYVAWKIGVANSRKAAHPRRRALSSIGWLPAGCPTRER